MPPAFALSQDQTLRFIPSPKTPQGAPGPETNRPQNSSSASHQLTQKEHPSQNIPHKTANETRTSVTLRKSLDIRQQHPCKTRSLKPQSRNKPTPDHETRAKPPCTRRELKQHPTHTQERAPPTYPFHSPIYLSKNSRPAPNTRLQAGRQADLPCWSDFPRPRPKKVARPPKNFKPVRQRRRSFRSRPETRQAGFLKFFRQRASLRQHASRGTRRRNAVLLPSGWYSARTRSAR
jgi:hypothetical protein